MRISLRKKVYGFPEENKSKKRIDFDREKMIIQCVL